MPQQVTVDLVAKFGLLRAIFGGLACRHKKIECDEGLERDRRWG
jgi:hypothetical protein